MKLILVLTLFGIAFARNQNNGGTSSSNANKAGKVPAGDFTCPEEFGYFPHPDDCSLYYVCVFGGALLESCTGGLMYSHDLQTCDWPRNVQCGFQQKQVTNAPGDGNAQTAQQIRAQVQANYSNNSYRQQQPSSILLDPDYQYHQIRKPVQDITRVTSPQQQYVDNSDLINNSGISPATPSSSPKYLTNIRFQDDNQADGSRLGRSYEQNVPNYKEELYTVGSNLTLKRVKRHALRNNNYYGPNPGHDNMYPSSYWRQTQRDLSFGTYAHQHTGHRMTLSPKKHYSPSTLPPPPRTTYSSPTAHHHQNYNSHSYYNTERTPSTRPTEYSNHRLKPITQQQRLAQQEELYQQNQGSRGQRLKEAMQNEYLEEEQQRRYRQNQHSQHSDDADEGDELQEGAERQHSHYPLKMYHENVKHRLVIPRTSPAPNLRHPEVEKVEYQDGFQPSTHWTNSAGEGAGDNGSKDIEYEDEEVLGGDEGGASSKPVSSQNENTGEDEAPIITIDDISVDGGRGGKTQQQEIIIDPEYLNQRYAANIQPVAQPVQPSGPANTNANASLFYDDAYYVYDDEKEEPHYDDVDYKAAAGGDSQREVVTIQTTTTTTTTKRPVPAPTPKPSSRPSSRGSSRHKSGNGGRPTLKPSASIVKDVQDNVRDVYVDAPSRPLPVYETPVPNTPSSKCRKDECVLPDCNCGGKDIPGGLPATSVPQIVLLTFDDSVNDLNKDLYRDLFEKGRKNPNGCPISATFYVSHEWTDYSQVQNLAADGHEIASHSVSHSFGEQFSQKKWDREIGGQREILAAYGGVKLSEVRGMRAPFLAIGGNNMFKMLHDSNFTYDSSMPVYENRPPSWPYTLDYRIFHDCMIPPCPTKSYPGVWEVPMVMWQDLKGGRCSMGDACSNPPTAEGVYNMLAKNFERHYTTNRAPFGLYYHAAWFTQPHHKEGFEAFLDTLVNMDDVWLVTNWQAIQWVRDPTPLNQVLNFEPFSCHNRDRPRRCNNPKVCNLWHKSGVRYMKTCQQCPSQYPWVGSTGVPNANSL